MKSKPKDKKIVFSPADYESKWQRYWDKKKTYVSAKPNGKKMYILDMFPYPSGDGLHVGHVRGYTATDILARYYRMSGFTVLHPMGWDAFGLPAENAAIKNKTTPQKLIPGYIDTFRRQMKQLGFSYDWEREFATTDPVYYQWTQWLFIRFFKMGLLYKKQTPIYYCPSCKTGLAKEEVLSDGTHERCGNKVERRELPQWIFRITKYADRLLDDLERLDWPSGVIEMQRNWIGRKRGELVKFSILNSQFSIRETEVFTTRIDTIFGVTYVAISPERAREWMQEGWRPSKAVKTYIEESLGKLAEQRLKEADNKTGIDTGLHAVNPANDEKVPIWVADYVMSDVGTGVVMGVPAHDERDHEFAITYNLRIKKVIDPPNEFKSLVLNRSLIDKQSFIKAIQEAHLWVQPYYDWGLIITGRNDQERAYISIIQNQLKDGPWYADADGSLKAVIFKNKFFKLPKEDKQAQKYANQIKIPKEQIDWQSEYNYAYCFDRSGVLENSGKYDGLSSEEAQEKILSDLASKNQARTSTNYHLRDWIFSRQRYWGEPIPMIYCKICAKNRVSYWTNNTIQTNTKIDQKISKWVAEIQGDLYGWYPVLEKDLPVELPQVKSYEPTKTGASPLSQVRDWVKATCPQCGGQAEREIDTMPNWAGSCWYYLYFARNTGNSNYQAANYKQTQNSNTQNIKLFDIWNLKFGISGSRWLPVDWYIGGTEHAVLHLLYSRFWMKAMYDLRLVDSLEPFTKLHNVGMVLAKDSQKMSKSRGNVINPDAVVEKYGADVLRVYEMFMAPFSQEIAWSGQTMRGAYRFLRRIWQTYHNSDSITNDMKALDTKLDVELQRVIYSVSKDITNVKFNTAIASMMKFLNHWEAKNDNGQHRRLSMQNAENFIKILAPFAPFMAEEIWRSILAKSTSIHLEAWPQPKKTVLKLAQIKIPVQVDGKHRDTITVSSDEIDKELVVRQALESTKIQKWLKGKKYTTIYVKGKILNFVIRKSE